ncbi:MAG: aldehyde dehydrogenase family protein, partial [Pseudomonadota bacterium]
MIEQVPDNYVADFDEQVSRSALEARAAKGAMALTALGVGEDVRLALIMRNDLTQLEIMRAAAAAGTVIVALNWHSEADEVAAICNDSGAETVIVHRDLIDKLRPALAGRRVIGVSLGPMLRAAYGITTEDAISNPGTPEWSTLVDGSEPLTTRAPMRPLLRYTSGSTGRPKAIRKIATGPQRDHRDLLRRLGAEMMQFEPGSRFFTAAPIYHSAPSTLTAAAMECEGVSALVAPRFDPEPFLATIEAQGSAAGTFRYYAEALDKVAGEVAPTAPDVLGLVHRAPVGVVGAIVPWNFPLMIGAWKLAPALAMGNSVVLKPAETASLSLLRLAE